MKTYNLLYLLLPWLTTNVYSLDVETVFGENGPSVCLSTPFAVPKYINAICSHRNLTYVGGLFNRFGDRPANSFAVLDHNDTIQFLGNVGADASLENIQRSNNDASKFGAIITTMACPEDSDYIYLGGFFRNVSNSKFDQSAENYDARKVEENDEIDYLMKLERNLDITVNNIALFNTVTRQFEPMRLNRSSTFDNTEWDKLKENSKHNDTGFSHSSGNEMAIVQTIECASNGGKSCEIMFVGGHFNDAMGVKANSIVMINQTNPSNIVVSPLKGSPTFNDEDDSNGVEGVVMSVSAINETSVVFGGIYSSAGGGDGKAPYMFNTFSPNTGISCVINEFMGDLTQCQTLPPPPICCEGAIGTIYSTLKISDDEVSEAKLPRKFQLILNNFINLSSPLL